MTFFRIFNVGELQVSICKYTDPKNNSLSLSLWSVVDGFLFQGNMYFSSEADQQAIFDSYGVNEAAQFINGIENMNKEIVLKMRLKDAGVITTIEDVADTRLTNRVKHMLKGK